MNLKYYLRGLGLGIIVTALVLSISAGRRSSMTDAQVKERAKELGMIENTVLVEKQETEESPVSIADTDKDAVDQPDTVQLETDKKDEKIAESDDMENTDKAETGKTDLNQKKAEEADKNEETQANADKTQKEDDPEAPVKKDEINKDDNLTVDEEPQNGQNTEETVDTGKKESAQAEEGTGSSGNSDAKTEDTSATENGNVKGTLTIVSGDSSYSVAKKLYAMGIGNSVEETDRYLCTNGYDRTIRVGNYEIREEDSLEKIAKMINGK